MKKEGEEVGYKFALPRLIARIGGRPVPRSELCRWEIYGLGFLVFGLNGIFAGRAFLPLVRSFPARILFLCLLPFALWIAFLLLYYVDALVVAGLRRLGLYHAITNKPFQSLVIMVLTTGLAAILIRDETGWMRSLGALWCGLLLLNLLAFVTLKILGEK
ncbi:hypothetical protein BH20VER3_BH20VER3_21310 [soil metagenome]